MILAVVESGKVGAAGQLLFEQHSNSLLQKQVSRFSQPEDLVVGLFAGTLSMAVACFTKLCYRAFVACKADQACF